MKLGSLFDGSGGFPLAGVLHGVEPVWASEIEPYPVRVTTARFPAMKHLGDVTKIDGGAVEPVDIITFGSPCQDLSVAGKQAGLHKGERSNLFFEAIRIIKEMRRSTNGIYPRIAIWENVPGAFSSNKGADFKAVLQAFAEINNPNAVIPEPPKGKWHPAGTIVGDGWSVAWRTLDAQFWGVPQRRRRIYLIADFGSERAGEILFEQESSFRDSAESGTAGEGAADNAEGGPGGGVLFEPMSAFEENWAESSVKNALRAGASKSSHAVCYVLQGNGIDRADTAGCNGAGWRENECYTLNTIDRPAVVCPIDLIRESRGAFEVYDEDAKIGGSLKQSDNKGSQVVCYPIDSHQQNSRFKICEDGVCPTVPGQMGTGGNNGPMVLHTASGQSNAEIGVNVSCTLTNDKDRMPVCYESSKPPRKYIIRRLTPLETCRLQGFPDWWEDGVQGSDSARYKMWGNGLALPNAAHVVGCAVKLIKETQTEDEKVCFFEPLEKEISVEDMQKIVDVNEKLVKEFENELGFSNTRKCM